MARSVIWPAEPGVLEVHTQGLEPRVAQHVRIHGPSSVDASGQITTRARLTVDGEHLNPPVPVPTGAA